MSDICRIIRESGRSGVSHLSYQGLQISFSTNSDRKLELPKATQTEIEIPTKIELTEEQKEEMREWDRLQLAIDDPVAYEDEMLEDDVERARHERVEDRRAEQDVHERGGRGS